METFYVNSNTLYLKFNSDSEMFDYLKDYEVINHYGLAVEIYKNNKYEILSYQNIDIENKTKEEIIITLENDIPKHDILIPNYNHSSLNIISSIRNNFGYSSKYDIIPNLFDKKYKRVVLLLLDGLGVNVLNDNIPNGILAKHYFSKVNCVFPSTTAASTTSIISGLTPLESGWTGWENYVSELNRDIVLFTGENYYTKEKTGVTGYDLMPYEPFYSDMNIKGINILPDFNNKNEALKDILKRSLANLNGECYQYVYYTYPDTLMHIYGEDTIEIKDILNSIENDIEDYVNKLPKDTILIVTSDHGHINTKSLNLYLNNRIMSLLERKPSNDARALVFKVSSDNKKKFVKEFNNFYGSIYDLYESRNALAFFGNNNDRINPRIKDFLGDYIAIGKSNYYFNYSNSNHIFKSHHAGMTKEEMEVPIIVFRR